jgi:hypothetical protein
MRITIADDQVSATHGAHEQLAAAGGRTSPEPAVIIPPRSTAIPDEAMTTQRNAHVAAIANMEHGLAAQVRPSADATVKTF